MMRKDVNASVIREMDQPERNLDLRELSEERKPNEGSLEIRTLLLTVSNAF